MTDKGRALLRLAASDYEWDATIWRKDTGRIAAAKRALATLPERDRSLMILYAEAGSLRKCGELVGKSHTWVARRIRAIRTELTRKIERYERNSDK